MHVELDCPWVSVSGGLRLLAPDGRSFRLRGATASADGHVEVPAKVAHHLYEAGVATEPCDLRVAVVSDHGCSDDLVRGLTARRIDITTWVRTPEPGNTRDLRRISGHANLDVHVVVICPRTSSEAAMWPSNVIARGSRRSSHGDAIIGPCLALSAMAAPDANTVLTWRWQPATLTG